MKTRELTKGMREVADYLDSIEEFDVESYVSLSTAAGEVKMSASFWDKGKFVSAIRTLGNVTKSYTSEDYAQLVIAAKDGPFVASIPRDKVCKKVVTYDCEPLFSAEEVEAL